jgi:hypothetical protein
MPRPLLGELAYTAYCETLQIMPQWPALHPYEHVAWGHAVHVVVCAANEIAPLVTTPPLDIPDKAYHAYVLYVLHRKPVQDVCAALGIGRRTLYRYVAAHKQGSAV